MGLVMSSGAGVAPAYPVRALHGAGSLRAGARAARSDPRVPRAAIRRRAGGWCTSTSTADDRTSPRARASSTGTSAGSTSSWPGARSIGSASVCRASSPSWPMRRAGASAWWMARGDVRQGGRQAQGSKRPEPDAFTCRRCVEAHLARLREPSGYALRRPAPHDLTPRRSTRSCSVRLQNGHSPIVSAPFTSGTPKLGVPSAFHSSRWTCV